MYLSEGQAGSGTGGSGTGDGSISSNPRSSYSRSAGPVSAATSRLRYEMPAVGASTSHNLQRRC